VSASPRILLVIGEAKCATSTLYAHLVSHPFFCPPPRKELHYFDRACEPAWNYDQCFVPTSDDYLRQLKAGCADFSEYDYLIDATPSYLRTPGVEELVKRHVQNPLFIISLRNPVNRLYSNYWMLRRRGREAEQVPFDEYADHYIETKRLQRTPITFDYATNIERWFDKFEDRSLFFVDFCEEMARDGRRYMARLGRFLGLPIRLDLGANVIPGAPINAEPCRHYPSMQSSTADRLSDYFYPYDMALERLLKCTLPWRRI